MCLFLVFLEMSSLDINIIIIYYILLLLTLPPLLAAIKFSSFLICLRVPTPLSLPLAASKYSLRVKTFPVLLKTFPVPSPYL